MYILMTIKNNISPVRCLVHCALKNAMKSLILSFITLCFVSLNVSSALGKIEPTVLQKDANGNWFYEKIIPVENTSKKELYARMKRWVISNVKTADNNKLQDDENYEAIITTPTVGIEDLRSNWIVAQNMNFKLTISFKDNKLKIYAASFSYYGNSGGLMGGPLETFATGKAWIKDLNPKFDTAFTRFIDELIAAASTKNDSNW